MQQSVIVYKMDRSLSLD